MHFNFVIPICLLVISFAFFHEVQCAEEKILALNNHSARLSRRGKFLKRCDQTNPPASGCPPLPNITDPLVGATSGLNTFTKSLPVQGIPADPATGYVPAQGYSAPVSDPIGTNPLGFNTGTVLSTVPNPSSAPTYSTIPQQVAQTPQQVAQTPQQVAQTPQQVAQTPQQVAQTPQQVAQTPQQVTQVPQPVTQTQPVAYGSPSISSGTSPSPPPSASTAGSDNVEKKSEDDDDDDEDDDDDIKKSDSENEDDDDTNNEDEDDEE